MIKPNFGKLFSWEKLFFYEVIQDSDFLSVDLGLQKPAWCPAVVFRDNTPEPTVREVCRYPFGSSGVLFSFISSEAYASGRFSVSGRTFFFSEQRKYLVIMIPKIKTIT